MQRQVHSCIQVLSKGLRNCAVTFLWVFCSHLSGKMWCEMRDGSCSCGFRFDWVQLNQQDPAEVQYTSTTRTDTCTCTRTNDISFRKSNTIILLAADTDHFSPTIPASFSVQRFFVVFFPLIIIVRSKKKKKNSEPFKFVGCSYNKSFFACEFLWLPFTDYWYSLMFNSVKIISTLTACYEPLLYLHRGHLIPLYQGDNRPSHATFSLFAL